MSCGHATKLGQRGPSDPFSFCANIAEMGVPFQIIRDGNGYAKIFDFPDVIKDRPLSNIESTDLVDPFLCNRHYITFARFEYHEPAPCPTP